MEHDKQLYQDVSDIKDDVKVLKQDVNTILHGNGRHGLWSISDALFGRAGGTDPGVKDRVKDLENESKERKWLRRGLATGVGFLSVEGVLGVTLFSFISGLFGR